MPMTGPSSVDDVNVCRAGQSDGGQDEQCNDIGGVSVNCWDHMQVAIDRVSNRAVSEPFGQKHGVRSESEGECCVGVS